MEVNTSAVVSVSLEHGLNLSGSKGMEALNYVAGYPAALIDAPFALAGGPKLGPSVRLF
jgi:hypothetical protein